jgi:hypothetical protein
MSFLAGVTLGVWLSGGWSPERARASAPTPAPGNELAPSLAEIARALQALRSTLEQQPPTLDAARVEAPEREPMTPAPGARDDAELVAALQAIAASLRERDRGAQGNGGGAGPALVVPAWVNRSAAFADFGMRRAQQADDGLAWDRAMDAFRKRHLFWTTQQVLDAYGKPDEIEVGEQYSTWTYRLAVVEAGREDGQEEYVFHLSDGLVFSADYSY